MPVSGADPSRRIVDVADRHLPAFQREVRQIVLEHWWARARARRSWRRLLLSVGATARRNHLGEEGECGDGIAAGHHHGGRL